MYHATFISYEMKSWLEAHRNLITEFISLWFLVYDTSIEACNDKAMSSGCRTRCTKINLEPDSNNDKILLMGKINKRINHII